MREFSRTLNVALCIEVSEGIEPYAKCSFVFRSLRELNHMLNVALCLEVSDGIEPYAKCSFVFRSRCGN